MEGDTGFAFRDLLLKISQKMRLEEARNLSYVYELPPNRGERWGSETLDTLVHLERKGLFSSSKPDGLLDILDRLQRQDLVELAKHHTMALGSAHQRSSIESGRCAQEMAEYRVAVAHVELLRNQTRKLRSYPHQAANAEILTTILRKVSGLAELFSQALDNLSSPVSSTLMPGSGTYGETGICCTLKITLLIRGACATLAPRIIKDMAWYLGIIILV